MVKYKSKVVCITNPSAYSLKVQIVNGSTRLKFNQYMQDAVNNIINAFKVEYLDGILRNTDGVGSEGFDIIPQYNADEVTITVVSKCGKGARPIAEDLDWWLFPRLQCVLAENGCNLSK